MEKLSFKNLNLKEVQQLSREQLQNVLGGESTVSIGGGSCPLGMAHCCCGSSYVGCTTVVTV